MSYERSPRGRLPRLFQAADQRHVPLRTILVTVGVVVGTYLAGKLLYLVRNIVLVMLVAGFVATLVSRWPLRPQSPARIDAVNRPMGGEAEGDRRVRWHPAARPHA